MIRQARQEYTAVDTMMSHPKSKIIERQPEIEDTAWSMPSNDSDLPAQQHQPNHITMNTQLTQTTSSSSSLELVPYYVLERSDGRTEVLFLVPSALVSRVTVHPILCRGSAFSLRLDDKNENIDSEGGSFLAVDFHSPYPDDLAREIAIRLTRRLEDARWDQEASRHHFLSIAP